MIICNPCFDFYNLHSFLLIICFTWSSVISNIDCNSVVLTILVVANNNAEAAHENETKTSQFIVTVGGIIC